MSQGKSLRQGRPAQRRQRQFEIPKLIGHRPRHHALMQISQVKERHLCPDHWLPIGKPHPPGNSGLLRRIRLNRKHQAHQAYY